MLFSHFMNTNMDTNSVRNAFLKFFKSKGHTIVPSSSLVPKNDPTLLFSNAGMNQFKDCFLGAEKRDYVRATTAQKCLRISGKHNDLENVGVTARHHTFFEMLGNFSFGDYFKEDAINYAWEFVTKTIGLNTGRLWITIFEEDDEAGKLWEKAGVSKDRILKCGEKDNFWAMGDTGPCGPCSELHYYIGNNPENQSETEFRKDDGTYLEFWNLVFMQFNRDKEGNLNPLPKPAVDTGMGLERMVSILNNYPANYDTDSLRGIISICEKLSGKKYLGKDYTERDRKKDLQYSYDIAMRVIADHSRATAFLIADGVLPGSDGRSYVLRRLIRRAIRYSRVLGFKKPFFSNTAGKVIEIMSDAYPELKAQQNLIIKVVSAEEAKFNETLDAGLEYLEKEIKDLKEGDTLSGKTAFLLHDTYGFPLDLTEDALKEHKISVNNNEFNSCMQAQKKRSRDDRKAQNISYTSLNITAEPTVFLGYEALDSSANLQQIINNEDGSFALIFNKTPFYAESGGQVGDIGTIEFKDAIFKVIDTQKAQGKYFVHSAQLVSGSINNLSEQTATLKVDESRRAEIKRHHSATHLVHAALKKFLGEHVHQAGSRVDEHSLRFDYSHFETTTKEQLDNIQNWVNTEIFKNSAVETNIMSLDEAKASGAMALFDEKYSDKVRVVSIGENSKELCGGTHVKSSGEIGSLIIHSDAGIATGTRRIECYAGNSANDFIKELIEERKQIARLLKTDENSVTDKLEKVLEQLKIVEKDLQKLKAKVAVSEADYLLENKTQSSSGIDIISAQVDNLDREALKNLVDTLRVKLGSGIVAIASTQPDNQAILITGATADLKDKINVGKILSGAVKKVGAKGGGRPDFAQAGGISSDDIEQVLNDISQQVG